MAEYQHDPEDPEAETVLLERVARGVSSSELAPPTDAVRGRVRASIIGQIVSTGDHFAGFEVVEIAPPDEPALVTERTVLEFV